MDTSLDGVSELVLDGQQRLTSLLHALSGRSDKRFFIQLSDISSDRLEVLNIVYEGANTPKGRHYDTPATAFLAHRIPMDVLLDETDERGLTPLARWCMAVGDHVGAGESRVLESKDH